MTVYSSYAMSSLMHGSKTCPMKMEHNPKSNRNEVSILRRMSAFMLKGKQAQLMMLTKPSNAFRGQSRSPNTVSFHMLGIVSY